MLRRGFTKLEFLVVCGLMVVLLGCLGAVLPLQILCLILFGWALHLYHLSDQVRIDWPELIGASIALGLFGLGLHLFCSWFAAAQRAGKVADESPKGDARAESLSAGSTGSRWKPKWTVSIVAVTVLMFVAGISMVGVTHHLAWMLSSEEPLVRQGMDAARRSSSQNNLKQIGISLYNYHDTHGAFPAGATADERGQLLHGWMTALLPYIEQNSLHEKIDCQRPWNDPANEEAIQTRIKQYELPYPQFPAGRDHKYGMAGYSGNLHLLGGTGPGMKLEQITDGTSNTLLGGEAFGNYQPWGHPRNWRDPALGINRSPHGFGGPRKSGGVMLVADGSVRHLSADTDPAVLKALATPAGGEPQPNDWP